MYSSAILLNKQIFFSSCDTVKSFFVSYLQFKFHSNIYSILFEFDAMIELEPEGFSQRVLLILCIVSGLIGGIPTYLVFTTGLFSNIQREPDNFEI